MDDGSNKALLNLIANGGLDTAALPEAKFFRRCPDCGQPIDARDQGSVFYHAQRYHVPMPPGVMVRLVTDLRLRAALLAGHWDGGGDGSLGSDP